MTGNVYFRIQLLSGKNVVLAEAEGYESEIFMPHIVNGRITFLNVIPNRRCCVMKGSSKVEHQRTTMAVKSEQLTPISIAHTKSSRISAGREKSTNLLSSPLAMSTPACPGKMSMGQIRVKNGTSMFSSMEEQNSLPTPDIARRDPGKRQDVAMDIATFNLPRGLKVMRLSSNPDSTVDKTGRESSPSKGDDQQDVTDSLTATGVHDLSNNFRVNSIPLMYNSYTNEIVSSTALKKRKSTSQTKVDMGKWRKVRTPKRTYSRRGDHTVPKHDKSLTSTVKKIKPSFLVNPTMGPKSTYTVEVKKRVMKVDDHIKIPSKVIKKRQLTNDKMMGSLSNEEQLQRSIKHIGNKGVSAFDLLTNSNRGRRISEKLNQQFRNGCVNKASSTYQKYKSLSTVPLLEQDEQILEITGKPKANQSQPIVAQSEKSVSKKADSGLSSKISRATCTTLSVPVYKALSPKEGNNAGSSANDGNKAFVKPKVPSLITTKRSAKIKKNEKEQYHTVTAQRLGISQHH